MRLDVYQREAALIAAEQSSLLDEAADRLNAGGVLSRLELNGVLHALQVLVENSIGKAKQLLNVTGHQVPISAYDSFNALADSGIIRHERLDEWRSAIGLRNRIVHDYMNIDMELVKGHVRGKHYQFVTEFLITTFDAEYLKSLQDAGK
jgi:uncharacterized protein YutE (UPF0331/DUF86 family)